jgi:hypothetical protein
MRRIGDRRADVRLEVVGALWGTLEMQKRAQLIDVNETGALLLSAVSLPINTVHAVEITRNGHSQTAEVRVRHVRPAHAGAFHLGLEFLAPLRSHP